MTSNKHIIKVGLIKGRHDDLPVKDFVFEKAINNAANVVKLQMMANVWALAELDKAGKKANNGVEVHLYITGLTPALIAVLNACRDAKWKVIAFCYNSDNKNYFPMEVK